MRFQSSLFTPSLLLLPCSNQVRSKINKSKLLMKLINSQLVQTKIFVWKTLSRGWQHLSIKLRSTLLLCLGVFTFHSTQNKWIRIIQLKLFCITFFSLLIDQARNQTNNIPVLSFSSFLCPFEMEFVWRFSTDSLNRLITFEKVARDVVDDFCFSRSRSLINSALN